MKTWFLFIILTCLPTPQDKFPGSWLDRFILAEKAVEEKSLDKATLLLKSCLELAPMNAITAYHLACTYARTDRLDEAETWLARAVEWGWVDADVILWDKDLASLREIDKFKELVASARKHNTISVSIFGLGVDKISPAFNEVRHITNGPIILPDDNTAMVAVSGGTLRGFDIETGGIKWCMEIPSDVICELEVLDDGTKAASSSMDGNACVYDIKNQKVVREFKDVYPTHNEYIVPEIRLHPHGDKILTYWHIDWYSAEKPAVVWCVKTGKKLYEVPSYQGIEQIAWSHDGSLLCSGHQDGMARLWNATTGSPLGKPMPHPCPVQSIVFEANGKRVATGAEDKMVRLWEVPTGELLCQLSLSGTFLFRFEVAQIAWTSKGDILATTCPWPTIQCWDGRTLKALWCMEEYSGGNPSPLYIRQNTSCTLLYAWGMTYDNTRLIDALTGRTFKDLGARYLWAPFPTADERRVIALHNFKDLTNYKNIAVVLEGYSLDELYRRAEFPGGEAILYTPTMIHMGCARAIQKSSICWNEKTYPLDCFAPILYDPKRFIAAAAGVPVSQPILPVPPRLIAITPKGRIVELHEEQTVIMVQASCEDGILGFQIEKDGKILPFRSVGKIRIESDEKTTLSWTIDRPVEDKTEIRLRAISQTGVLSRPAFFTLRWQ